MENILCYVQYISQKLIFDFTRNSNKTQFLINFNVIAMYLLLLFVNYLYI